jgi:hypothetical protein
MRQHFKAGCSATCAANVAQAVARWMAERRVAGGQGVERRRGVEVVESGEDAARVVESFVGD